jgi:hypothetical protein
LGLWQSAMYGEQEGGTAQLRPARMEEDRPTCERAASSGGASHGRVGPQSNNSSIFYISTKQQPTTHQFSKFKQSSKLQLINFQTNNLHLFLLKCNKAKRGGRGDRGGRGGSPHPVVVEAGPGSGSRRWWRSGQWRPTGCQGSGGRRPHDMPKPVVHKLDG